MEPGTLVKIITDYSQSQDRIGVVVKCDDLPPWAIALVKLDNGGCYAFSENEVELA